MYMPFDPSVPLLWMPATENESNGTWYICNVVYDNSFLVEKQTNQRNWDYAECLTIGDDWLNSATSIQ